MTPDERIVQAFLVADDFFSRGGGATPAPIAGGIPIVVDSRMPPGMTALGSPNGSIVVREMP